MKQSSKSEPLSLIEQVDAEIYKEINIDNGEKIADRANYRNGLRFARDLIRAHEQQRESVAEILRSKGLAIVPIEPTIAMVEAALKALRLEKKARENCIKAWAPNAGKPHPHEPGIVSELRAAITAGKLQFTEIEGDK